MACGLAMLFLLCSSRFRVMPAFLSPFFREDLPSEETSPCHSKYKDPDDPPFDQSPFPFTLGGITLCLFYLFFIPLFCHFSPLLFYIVFLKDDQFSSPSIQLDLNLQCVCHHDDLFSL